MLPKRPKMDPNDPTETYTIPQFPEAINESMSYHLIIHHFFR